MTSVGFAVDGKLHEEIVNGVVCRWRRMAASPAFGIFAGGCDYGDGDRPWLALKPDVNPEAYLTRMLEGESGDEVARIWALMATLCGVEWRFCEKDPVGQVHAAQSAGLMLQPEVLHMKLTDAADLREHMVGSEDPRSLAMLVAHTWAAAYEHVGSSRPLP